MEKYVDVAIIGAGSAGLYAMGQIKRQTDNFVLIQVAEDFHRRTLFNREGIEGRDALSIDGPDVLEHVQDLRDIFVDKVLSSTIDNMGDEFIPEHARFLEPGLL